MRRGDQYRNGLADNRCVYVNGEAVRNPAAHPAFSGIVNTVAGLYDYAAEPKNGMTYVAPETGEPANKVFMIPRTREDLAARRAACEAWARRTHGQIRPCDEY